MTVPDYPPILRRFTARCFALLTTSRPAAIPLLPVRSAVMSRPRLPVLKHQIVTFCHGAIPCSVSLAVVQEIVGRLLGAFR